MENNKIEIPLERYEELVDTKTRFDLIETLFLSKDSLLIEDVLLIIGTKRALNRIEELKEIREREIREQRRKMESAEQE